MLFTIFLLLFPLMFMPVVGVQTSFGTLATSDFVLPVIYLTLLPAVITAGGRSGLPRSLTAAFVIFVVWAIVSTVSIPVRYAAGSETEHYVLFGLFKLGKFGEYAIFGLLFLPWLTTSRRIEQFRWILLLSMILLAVVATYNRATELTAEADELGMESAILGGKNGVSTLLALMATYFCVRGFYAKRTWPTAVINLGSVALACGAMLITGGRGGWVAILCGIPYSLLSLRKQPRLIGRGVCFAAVLVPLSGFIIAVSPAVQARIDQTFHPLDYPQDSIDDFTDSTGLDDGARLVLLRDNILRLEDVPILGTGFYHRSSETRISETGSHNFFVQMALETGLVGFACVMAMMGSLWFQIGKGWPHSQGDLVARVALRAAIVATVAGCFSGEYLYGGLHLLCLSALGALTVAENRLPLGQRTRAQIVPGDLLAGPFLVRNA